MLCQANLWKNQDFRSVSVNQERICFVRAVSPHDSHKNNLYLTQLKIASAPNYKVLKGVESMEPLLGAVPPNLHVAKFRVCTTRLVNSA
jgi:hypothetical protein